MSACTVCGTETPRRSLANLAAAVGDSLAIAARQPSTEGQYVALRTHVQLLQRELLGACGSCAMADVARMRLRHAPTQEEIEEAYVERKVIPLRRHSGMVRDLLTIPETKP